MYKIPLGGGGVYSQPSKRPRELHFTFLCDMGLPCSTYNNSKSIEDRNAMLAVLKSLIKFSNIIPINEQKLVSIKFKQTILYSFFI